MRFRKGPRTNFHACVLHLDNGPGRAAILILAFGLGAHCLPSPAACRAANSPYNILGLLPDPEGGLSDITGLYLDKFSLLPAGRRIFIQTVQQINGWRNLPPNHLRPYPRPVG